MRQLCVLLLVLFISVSVHAQSRQEQRELPTPPQRFDRPIRFENLGLEDGLEQGSIYAIHQDSQGFLWFGTQGGISRFDGYSFKNFKHIPFDSTSAETSWVFDIDEAPDGTFWLASTYRGISHMDPSTEKFIHYRHDPNDSTSLSAGWVNTVHLDSRGTLWVGVAGSGLNRMDPNKPGRFDRFLHRPDDPSSISSDAVFLITEIDGVLWISTGNGLNRMDLDEPGRFRRYLTGSDSSPRSPDPVARVRAVYAHQEHPEYLWVASEAGLTKLNISTGETKTVFPHGTFMMTQDPEDSDVLWVTTLDSGLVRFDMESETGVRFRHDPTDPESLVGDNTIAIHTDRSGTIWVGTNPDGISKFNPSAISFAQIRHDPTGRAGLPEASAWGILIDRKGDLWVAGTDRGLLQRMDLETGRVQVWEPNFGKSPDKSFPAGRPFVIKEDARGTLWISTNRGLNRYDPATGRHSVYVHDPDDETSLSANNISSLFIDRKGAIWVGTRTSGLNRLDVVTGRFTRYVHDPADPTSIGGNVVFAIQEDRSGVMWLGTNDGLSRMDLKNPGEFTTIVHDPRNPKGLTNGNITAIHERDREPGILWLATSGGGVDRFDTRAGTFTHLTEQNSELVNNHVYTILEDDAGRLWMSTNRGISRYDPETKQFSNFGIEHGLKALEFNQWSAAKAPDGQMYFGGVKGLNSFYPEGVGSNDMAPPIALTDLRLFNSPVAPGPGSPLQQALSRTKEISLTYDQARNVGFDFVALHFKNSAKNRYAYQLEGFDGDWIQAGTQRSATYTNLPPGEYTFRVRAANSDGVWNEEGTMLQLVVLPPWWRTSWAYMMYGLLLVGAVVAADRIQRRRLRKKSILEQAELRAQAAESETEAAQARALALQADNERKKNAELLSEIGKEITASLDLETIFDRLYEHVNNLLEAPVFGVGLYSEEREQIDYRLAMENGVRYAPYSRDTSDKNQFPVWCIENRGPIFINDVEAEYSRYIESYTHAGGRLEDGTFAQEPQSLMYLPLISKDRVLGVVSVQSFSKGAYSEHDLNILQALATYTAIAVDNADAYRRLNTTFDHLREAQQQLVQQEKLASLGQLTAGIAHEIKNPLNFVTNFSVLNEELTAELEETLRASKSHLPEGTYREMEDLMTSLRVNSGHVAKHGRRADSIVKSMMEHASGGQGERYPVEVNAFLEEYVNLAYHGRRAQSPGFQVTLERHFDDEVGSVEMAPQELGRVVLNLLTNAFDAVSEKAAASNGEFTPRVAVRTRRRDGQVEIRVEDNGPGIPDHIRGRIFEPFFTTKPTGSGTGLGLSLSYDIVTQGHGGKLMVSSDEGTGTVFTVALPGR